MKQTIVVRAEIFREGHLYLGVCPDLNVSSFGETIEGAKSACGKLWKPSLRSVKRWERLRRS